MQNSSLIKPFRPLILVFIATSTLLIIFGRKISEWGIDSDVVIVGNIVLILATGISSYLYHRSLLNNKTAVFMRMIYGGMFAKMFICLIGAFIYIIIAQKNVNRGAIFVLMGLYLLYSFIEISILLKLSKHSTNG